MKITKIITLIMVLAMLFVFTACTPTPCDVCVDSNGDSKCDVCGGNLCDHVDINGDEICEFCGGALQHTTCVDSNSDGKCDKCQKCLTHNDALDDGDAKCDNCGVCVYHAKDDAKDLTCDICGETYVLTTIAEAKAIAAQLAEDETTPVRYYIYATVSSVTNPTYGGMYIEDETGSMSVYGTYSADGSLSYAAMTEQPGKGDKVLVACVLKKFKGVGEITNARLIAFDDVALDLTKYTEMDIADARDAEKGTFIKLTGTVARITYANGKIPQGLILVDGESSIYVFDNAIAGSVVIGNTITVAGEKDYWILDKEVNYAEKFGYLGCNQLTDCYLLENDGALSNVDLSFAEETTVKDVIDIPVTEDISGLIYKVNALIVRDEKPDYVNYYIFDIDGKTGTYTYTQCNGADFAWLDEFDGKICTVYVTAQNAKSTVSGCNWRFLPVAVSDDGYEFDKAGTQDYVLTYHALTLFLAKYSASPSTAFPTTVSSELLGFEGATVSYTSDNESVLSFTTDGEYAYMVCNAYGTANVTITVTYNGVSKSETITVEYAEPAIEDAISVPEAKAAEKGEVVIVTGIVGASLVNKVGFYLVDENGIIAVQATSAFMKEIEIGDEIIIKATRSTNDANTMIYLDSPELVANLRGGHDYSDASFIKDMTMADIWKTTDTAQGYTIEATITVETKYSINYYLTVDGTNYLLYSSNGGGLGFLDAYKGQSVWLDISICNWNNKGNRVVVHAVYTDSGKVISNNCFNFT